jgi:hypothetical protein
MHIEFFLEEPSVETFLNGVLQQILPASTTWKPIVFQGKPDLLANLERRLKGYKSWMPKDWKIVVLINEDRADCLALKKTMEAAAAQAGLITKSAAGGGSFTVLNRIAVEELEAWYFGDIEALVTAYPRVPKNLGANAHYRNSDTIGGGTWEALERVLQRAGYFGGGLSKIELAREMARHMKAARNTSSSFKCFTEGLAAL